MRNKQILLSGRAVTTNAANVPADRYSFLHLSDAEPNLGTASANGWVLVYDTSTPGNRLWSKNLITAYEHANAAYISQNTTGVYANASFIHANNAYDSQNTTGLYANSAFSKANSAYDQANSAASYANSSFLKSNSAYDQANSAASYANSAFLKANSAYGSQNTTGTYANAAYAQANSASLYANGAFIQANAAYNSQNITGTYANNAYVRANNSLNANVGGTVTGNVTIVGDLVSNTLTITGSGGNITGANAIFANYIFANNIDLQLLANSAYAQANSASLYANGAFVQANAAYGSQNTTGTYANAAFLKANSAYAQANSASLYANGSFVQANAAYDSQNTTGVYANSAFLKANSAYDSQNTTGVYANAAYAQANSGSLYANAAFIQANAAYDSQNTTGVYANSAYVRANNSLDANSGGTVTGNVTVQGDLSITGNVFVLGNSFVISAGSLIANDSLLVLGANNYYADILDIGFAGHYNDGVNAHAGLIRDATNKEWYLFKNYTPEIGPNNNIITTHSSFTADTLNANLRSNNTIVRGIEIGYFANASYNTANASFIQANAGFTHANLSFLHANSAHLHANSAYDQANSAALYANAAFVQSNSGYTHANSAYDQANSAASYANSGFLQANSAYESQNVTGTYANNAYTFANGAFTQANAGFIHANSAYDTINTLTVIANTTNTIIIGFSETANQAFIKANAAYESQNVTGTYANNAYQQANSAALYANGAFVQANAAFNAQNTTGVYTNASFTQANVAFNTANDAFIQANAAFIQANAAYESQNTTGVYANASFVKTNSAYQQANSAYDSQNTTGVYANSAYTHANAAFTAANNATDTYVRAHANASYNTANAAFTQANAAFIQANAAVFSITVNVDQIYSNSSGGNVLLGLANVNNNIGTYGGASAIPVVNVDGYGRVLSVSNTTISVPPGTYIFPNTNQLTANATSGNIRIGLANVNVDIGTYGNAFSIPTITIDGYGRILNVINTSISIPDGTYIVNSSLITSNSQSGNVVLSLAPSGVVPGIYGGAIQTPVITVDQFGRITAAINVGSSGGGSSTGLGTIFRNSFTATAAQTSFQTTSSFAADYLDVYINGLKLSPADYVANQSTATVTILNPVLQNGDVVDIQASTSYALTANTAYSKTTYLATSGQYVFTIDYTPGSVNVYLNGLRLQSGTDYTASNGTQIVFAVGLELNDVVEIEKLATATIYSQGTQFATRNTITVTANGDTTFIVGGGYRVNFVDVFVNGLKVNIPNDVIANNGNTIIFQETLLEVDDIIEVTGIGPDFTPANAISIFGGSISGNLDATGTISAHRINCEIMVANTLFQYNNLNVSTLYFQDGSNMQTAAFGNGGGANWRIITANTTAARGDGLLVDTTSANVYITLNSSPYLGNTTRIVDMTGNFGINNCIIKGNGKKIMGSTQDLVISSNNAGIGLVYSNLTHGWRLIENL